MHGVISPMMISPWLDDPISGRMKRLIVIVGHHHAEIIFGAERTHLILDNGGELEFFQSGPRVFVQGAHPGIGDRRRPPHTLELERTFAARHGLYDVFGVHRRLTQRFDDLVMQPDMHRFPADQSHFANLACQLRQALGKFLEWPDIADPRLFLRPRDVPRRRQIEHRRIVERDHQHGIRTDADEVGEIGNVVHAQEIMPPGIVHQQSLQPLVAHGLTHLGQATFKYFLLIHSHLVNLAAILIKSNVSNQLEESSKVNSPLHAQPFVNDLA